MSFPDRLRADADGITTRALAACVTAAGFPVTNGTISNWQSGKHRPTHCEAVVALAIALDVEPAVYLAELGFDEADAAPWLVERMGEMPERLERVEAVLRAVGLDLACPAEVLPDSVSGGVEPDDGGGDGAEGVERAS